MRSLKSFISKKCRTLSNPAIPAIIIDHVFRDQGTLKSKASLNYCATHSFVFKIENQNFQLFRQARVKLMQLRTRYKHSQTSRSCSIRNLHSTLTSKLPKIYPHLSIGQSIKDNQRFQLLAIYRNLTSHWRIVSRKKISKHT